MLCVLHVCCGAEKKDIDVLHVNVSSVGCCFHDAGM